MKPLILEFKEEPNFLEYDAKHIEYSKEKNLTVLKKTKKSAISYLGMETETFTKSIGEPSDCDNDLRNELKIMMGTETETRVLSETSDSDTNLECLRFSQLK
ncbi:hypothetical protein [Flammeovirga aprica]|uniref:Uncharacterized protein n=1 Tax=Flammeovirga aprica JL-4 TaxID=694437 RepID=A0A7X9S1N4_9BACT|nr:hypothetical protein [Flammeovirga aprica]NME72651.1 hypothetical protein [Flammeovirga aprica JL-4]